MTRKIDKIKILRMKLKLKLLDSFDNWVKFKTVCRMILKTHTDKRLHIT